jgi:hypothetical protein
MLRIESDGFCAVGDRPHQIALRRADDPPIVVGARMLWIEPDGFRIVGRCPGQIALRAARIPPIVVGSRILRIEPDGLGIVGDGPGRVALCSAGIPPIIVETRMPWSFRSRPPCTPTLTIVNRPLNGTSVEVSSGAYPQRARVVRWRGFSTYAALVHPERHMSWLI